jgi:hypothetical protein
MSELRASHQVIENPRAILCTNASGNVIFADANFARLAHQDVSRLRVTKTLHPLHDVLGIAQETAAGLLAEISAFDHFDTQRIKLRTRTGSLIPAWGKGIAIHNQTGAFVGADIVLTENTQKSELLLDIADHAGVLGLYTAQLMDEARIRHDKTYLQVYLTAQIDGLQLLLLRMAGIELRNALEAFLNKEAYTKNWPIVLREGEIIFARQFTPFNTHYGEVLRAAASFTADVVSRRMVMDEMNSIDRHLDPHTLTAISDIGLRIQL